jgi:hypothetical protein
MGVRALTKTQIALEQKAGNRARAKAIEEKKLTMAARKVERAAKKHEKLITLAESKAARASAKAKELRIELADVIKANPEDKSSSLSTSSHTTYSTTTNTAHSHKKSKGSMRTSSINSALASQNY